MKFKYSICYPDKDEIDYFQDPVCGDDLHELMKEFDWEKELAKRVDHYSPSFDFINLEDNRRIILSGVGKAKLESFQVMFILPKWIGYEDVFNDENYYNTDSYSKVVSVNKGYEFLQKFIQGKYEVIKKSLNKDMSMSDFSVPDPEPVSEEEKLKPGKSDKTNIRYEIIDQNDAPHLFYRILGPLLSLISLMVFIFLFVNSVKIGGYVFFSGGVFVLLLITTIYFENEMRK